MCYLQQAYGRSIVYQLKQSDEAKQHIVRETRKDAIIIGMQVTSRSDSLDGLATT